MSETEDKRSADRMPRGAIITVIVGLVVTLGVIAVDLRGGQGSSDSITWSTVESVRVPAEKSLGPDGSFGLTRTTLSAIPPTESGDLLFRVASSLTVDPGSPTRPVTVRCDVKTTAPDSVIARTQKRRAAWPRPSIELQAQPVPEELVVKFQRQGADVLGLPVRDSFRAFTDSAAPTDVDWDGFVPQTQNWVWSMPEGTGEGGATLAWTVVFRTTERPDADIRCSAASGAADQTIETRARQTAWPLEEE
jgi:hypothetical protein